MIHYIIGTAGSGKSTEIIEKIRDNIASNIFPLIIIPDQFSFEFDSKLYQKLGEKYYNLINTRSFDRLAEMIFMKYGGKSGEYADNLTKMAVIYQAVQTSMHTKSLKSFTKQTEKNNFLEFILKIIDEMKKADISADAFSSKIISLPAGSLKDKAEDISLIYNMYESILQKNKLKDKLNDISQASEKANIFGFFKDKTIYIDEFDNFSGDELNMLEVMVSQCKDLYICLRMKNINSSDIPFYSSHKTYIQIQNFARKYNKTTEIICTKNQYRFKNPELKHLSQYIYNLSAPKQYINTQNNIKIFEANDFYKECEFVCSEICRLIKDQNYNFKDITIVSRNPEEYSGVLEACLKRYHIPYFMDMDKSVMHTSIMLMIISILDILSAKKPSTETILKLLKTQLLGISYNQISEIENYCYKWNIDGDTWNKPFTAEISPDSNIEELRQKIISDTSELRKKCYNTTGKNICIALFDYLEKINIPQNISGLAKYYREHGLEYLANELKRLWGCLVDLLDVLSNILNDTIISPAQFNKLLCSMLKQNKYKNPPHSLDAVSFSSAVTARYNEPKVMFIIGVNDGIFPNTHTPESLLTEKERLELKNYSVELHQSSEEIINNENAIFYRAVSAPSQKLYLSYPLSDTTGNTRFPSEIIYMIENMFKQKIKYYDRDFNMEFYSPTADSAYYNYVQNLNKNLPNLELALEYDDVYMDKINYLKSIDVNKDFYISDKKLIKTILTPEFNISATKFETYNFCHFKFFCSNMLGIYKREVKNIDNLQKGNLIHMCLENILSACNKETFNTLSKNELLLMITKNMKEFQSSELGGDFAKSARFEANYQKLKNIILQRLIHLQQEFSQSLFIPIDYELKITDNICTANNIPIKLNGKIDRVDMMIKDYKKYIRIIDYKKDKKFKIENLIHGIDMQTLLYLFTIIKKYTLETQEKGEIIPAGALYMPYANAKCIYEKKDYEEILNKNYEMSGIILEEPDIILGMDKNILTKGIYVPVSLKKGKINTNKDTVSMNEKQFQNLEKYIRKKIGDVTDGLYNGDISANPFIQNKDKKICDYCDYKEICGNAWQSRCRYHQKDDLKQIMAIINEEL